MKEVFGGPGKVSGLMLRVGQFSSAAASAGFMFSAHAFSNTTAFCYLIASMALQFLWTFGLACLDLHALKSKKNLQSPVLLSLFVVGDWVTAFLSLAGASSAAAVTVLYTSDLDTNYCKLPPYLGCNGFKISVSLAFTSWFLLVISCTSMFRLLAAL